MSTWHIYFSHAGDLTIYSLQHVVATWSTGGRHVPSCGSINPPHSLISVYCDMEGSNCDGKGR